MPVASNTIPTLPRTETFAFGQIWLSQRGHIKRVVGFNAVTQAVLRKGVDGDGRKELRSRVPRGWTLVDESAYRAVWKLPPAPAALRPRLNSPRLHYYDPSLVMAAEAAKYRQPDFSDCHWCTLLVLAYRESAYTKEEYAKAKAAKRLNTYAMRHASALEMVIRVYVNQGSKAAREFAARLEAEGESFPAWMKLDTDDNWRKRVAGPPPRFRFDANGFICGEDQRPLDGD